MMEAIEEQKSEANQYTDKKQYTTVKESGCGPSEPPIH